MKSKTLLFVVAILVSVLCINASSYALEYSADAVITSSGQKMHGKMYASEDRFRMEMTSPQKMITISRMDKNVIWNIMPSQKMYIEMPFDPNTAPKTDIKGEIDRKLLDTETIDGHPTEKYLVTFKNGGQTQKIHQWLATDINFPIKTAAPDNKWVQEYKNIKVGPQPDKLFEVPEGYTKMEMPTMPGGFGIE